MYWKRFLILAISLTLGILAGFLFAHFSPPPSIQPLTVLFTNPMKKPRLIIGFQPYWLLSNTKDDYSPYITTLSYFGLLLTENGSIQKLVNQREEEPGWTTLKGPSFKDKLAQMKTKGVHLSILVQASDEDVIASLMEKPVEHAQNLLADISPIMKTNGFTDLNLDIESFKDASASTQQNFTQFVAEIKKGLNEEHLGTLTVDVTPISLVKDQLINLGAIAPFIDYIVLMGYDFHYSLSSVSGPVAPIGGAGEVREYDVSTSLTEGLKQISSEKFILGIPLYGYEWETLSSTLGSPVIPGTAKAASYRRILEILKTCTNCTKEFDKKAQQPSIIFPSDDGNGFHQIFYEDEQSLQRKLTLVKEKNIAGIALWALGYEDGNLLEGLKTYR